MSNIGLKYVPLLLGIFGTLAISAEARNYTSKECMAFVNHVNKDLPEIVDKVTVLRNSTCLVAGNVAEFTYVYELDVENISISSLPEAFKRNITNGFCSNPDSQVFFKGLTAVKMDYYEKKSGKFFGRIEIKKSDC